MLNRMINFIVSTNNWALILLYIYISIVTITMLYIDSENLKNSAMGVKTFSSLFLWENSSANVSDNSIIIKSKSFH